jgi:hypothetical protein
MIRVTALNADGLTMSTQFEERSGELHGDARRRGVDVLAKWAYEALRDGRDRAPVVYGIVVVKFLSQLPGSSYHYDVQHGEVTLREFE